ncbi:bacterial Ig-like domain protein [Clostridium puniceum]|uniref:Bacterial Ig-like domain protein n=1 Tax=Clostridium puniceum TaxID=29367 RepID=A0A1S8TXM9_9CLOT|nr:Ig-like domain-containing protein [Clostridium puniceum]OOM82506.1 bacterial Ig-like domain protein [Clostridium puniceum]
MKNYFKKFSIMFVMLLTVIGVGIIQNGNVANAATVGQQLTQPENGWRRYDDSDSRITSINVVSDPGRYGGSVSYNPTLKFYGCKIRIIDAYFPSGYASNTIVTIDGVQYPSYSCIGSTLYKAVVFEKNNLSLGVHIVSIKNGYADAIDIDDTGKLIPYNESIILDKSSLDLKEDDSKQLTATTTPAGSEVVWTSSDESVATVDSNGKVTSVKEGQVTITAQIKGSETKATCDVTVALKDEKPPVDEPAGDGNLYIEMVDGNIKQAQGLDVTDFIKWFKNRDLDDNDNPIYKIKNAKGNVEYLVHDKVVAFELR